MRIEAFLLLGRCLHSRLFAVQLVYTGYFHMLTTSPIIFDMLLPVSPGFFTGLFNLTGWA